MRVLFLGNLAAVFIIASCSPTPPPRPVAAPVAAVATPALPFPAPAAPSIPTPSAPSRAPELTQREISGITFEGVAFDSSTHRLAVIDQPGGPGSRFPDARSAAASRNGIAAINAGFFTPEGAPLGKLIAAGKPAGSWNRASSLGSGVFYEAPSGNLALARREAVSSSAAQRELLQAGPMLIENGRAVPGLNADKPAVRIFLLWDGGSRWWLGRSSLCTLSQLGGALSQASPGGFAIRHALNLDGGRSADLWVSQKVSGGPIERRSVWNRPVRNFLVLVPR